jgi:hypothetical protein
MGTASMKGAASTGRLRTSLFSPPGLLVQIEQVPEEWRQYWLSGRSMNVGGRRQTRTRTLPANFGYTLQTIDKPIKYDALKRKAQSKVTA